MYAIKRNLCIHIVCGNNQNHPNQMEIRLISLLLFTFFLDHSNGQPLPLAVPEEVGLSTERLNRISSVMDRYIEDGYIAGSVTMVARKGRLAWHESHGMMNIEHNIPMKKDALFQIASMTKAITSTAAMLLYEEGHFLLSDPISRYIPEFRDPMVIVPGPEKGSYDLVPAKSEITIRNILNFTGGIGRNELTAQYDRDHDTPGTSNRQGQTLRDRIPAMGSSPLISHPGEEFHYGNPTDILGYLVEVISGMKFNEFLRERIFIPLKMYDTFFILPAEKEDRLASMYAINKEDGKIRPEARDHGHLLTRTYFSGGSGLISSGPDYLRFAQMILNRGALDGARILSPKSVELMTSNSIGELYSAFPHNSGDKFGLGFGIRTERGTYDELESVGTFGWDGAYYTRFFIDPGEDLIGIFMSQTAGGYAHEHDLATRFRVLVFQSILE